MKLYHKQQLVWLTETISIQNMTGKIASDMIIIESLIDCGFQLFWAKMLEVEVSMLVSWRLSINACVTHPMRVTWQICLSVGSYIRVSISLACSDPLPRRGVIAFSILKHSMRHLKHVTSDFSALKISLIDPQSQRSIPMD